MTDEELDELRQKIIDFGIASEEAVDLTCNVAGYNQETLETIIFAQTGYENIQQVISADE